MASNSIVSERALREIYLKGFETALKSCESKTIMSSYNLINGEHTCNSRDLLTHVLRDEWGYEGLVMTDWYASNDMVGMAGGRVNKYPAGDAAGCVHAGNELSMPGFILDKISISDSLLEGADVRYPISRAELQREACRVLKLIQDMTK